jgi:hypothetical protein
MKLGTCADSWRNGNDMRDEDKDKSSMESREQALESQACLVTSPLERNRGLTVVSRPVRHGDVRTVKRSFDGLSERSRRHRFSGPKPCLTRSDLKRLSTVDKEHQAVVAYLEGRPIALALIRRLTRILTIQYEGSDLSIRASIS